MTEDKCWLAANFRIKALSRCVGDESARKGRSAVFVLADTRSSRKVSSTHNSVLYIRMNEACKNIRRLDTATTLVLILQGRPGIEHIRGTWKAWEETTRSANTADAEKLK